MATVAKNKKAQSFKYLLIKLQGLELREDEIIGEQDFVYFSFSNTERMFFSSIMDARVTALNDDLIIPLNDTELPEFVMLQRWQNHMVMFSHEVALGDLRNRDMVSKKVQTKAGQILSFMITVLDDDEIKFGNRFIKSISQHYLILQSLKLKGHRARDDPGPSYFIISTAHTGYIIPILDGEVCLKLPESLEFEYFRNGKLAGKSRRYNSRELIQSQMAIPLDGRNNHDDSEIEMSLRWGINLYEAKTQNVFLLQAHEISIYDIEVKFDNYSEFTNTKVKFIYGSKCFEVEGDFGTAKPSKIKKIICMMIKSPEEEISIVAERNSKVVAQSKFYTDELITHTVSTPKRKFISQHGSVIGHIKFKCQMAKNLSTPNNNRFWKESNKKKMVNMVILSIDQISVNYPYDEPVCAIIKTQSDERVVSNVSNFNFFDKNQQVSSSPIVITSRPMDNVYLMVKKQNSVNVQPQEEGIDPTMTDFIGIAILNFDDLRLGVNSVSIPFFKNQTKTVTLNCVINKVTPYPFVKSLFQGQVLHSHSQKTITISVNIKKVLFSPYFYTYNYQNKNQVYCIVEANRLKKVLIMESQENNDLLFHNLDSSDILNFTIEDTEFVKVKVIFLISDLGHEEEIYGSAVMKMKTGELANAAEDGLIFKKVQIKNDFGTVVGVVSSAVHLIKGSTNTLSLGHSQVQAQRPNQKSPYKNDLKKVQQDINRVHRNMQKMEQSRVNVPVSVNPIRKYMKNGSPEHKKAELRYDEHQNNAKSRRTRNSSVLVAPSENDSLHLPNINSNRASKQKSSLKDLVQMMKVKRRNKKNGQLEGETVQSVHLKQKKQSEQKYLMPPIHSQNQSSIEKEKAEKNMEILFPKREKRIKDDGREPNQLEEKLKKLRNEYDDLQQDLEELEAEEKNALRPPKNQQQQNMKGPEWEDNQFAMP